MRAAHFFWVGLAVVAFGIPIAYRWRVEQQFERLREEILTAHLDERFLGTSFVRMGDDHDSIDASLFEDVTEGLRRRCGLRSRLDFDMGGPIPASHAYLKVNFGFGPWQEETDWIHPFIWSPTKLQFLPSYAWCRTPGCPGAPR